MGESLKVLVTGLGVVFFGLVCLIGIIYLMSFLVRLGRRDELSTRRKHEEVDPIPQSSNAGVSSGGDSVPALTGAKRRETVAAVSAAVAEYLGTDIEGIRIHSIKRVGGSGELPSAQRRELVAAISAAIAEEMGSDISAIRILSIRKAS